VIIFRNKKVQQREGTTTKMVTAQMFEFPDFVDASFKTTLTEPTFYSENQLGRSFRPILHCFEKTYTGIQVGFYYFLTLIIGSILSVAWGLIFGTITFATVWVAHPVIKITMMTFRCAYVCTRPITRMLCDPCYESMSIFLSNMQGRFQITQVVDGEKVVFTQPTALQEIQIMK